MTSRVPIVERSELEQRSTRELLGRLRRLQACEEAPEFSDLSPEEIALASNQIVFKNSRKWRIAHWELKTLLATREHVPGGDERRKKRHERARMAGSVERHPRTRRHRR